MNVNPIKFDMRHAPKVTSSLVRLGGAGDGGYLVDTRAIENTKYVIGLGMFFDWRFEKDLAAKAGCMMEMHDYSVTNNRFRIWIFAGILRLLAGKINYSELYNRIMKYTEYKNLFSKTEHKHFKTKIGNSAVGTTNLTTVLSKRENVFLKVDIEGSEYEILDEIIKLQSSFSGIVIEFHDFWLHYEKIYDFLELIEMNVAHMHVNTAVIPNKDTGEGVIEITLTPYVSESVRTDIHALDEFIPGTEMYAEVMFDES